MPSRFPKDMIELRKELAALPLSAALVCCESGKLPEKLSAAISEQPSPVGWPLFGRGNIHVAGGGLRCARETAIGKAQRAGGGGAV